MAITQDNRLLTIETPLGKDVLLLQSLTGSEQLSQPFNYDAWLLAEVAAGSPDKVDPAKLVGKAVTITIRLPDGKARYVHGMVRRFAVGGADEQFVHYRAEIVPWLSLLELASNCRVFQGKGVKDIVEQVFQDLNFSDFEFRLNRQYEVRDLTVQYRETDLNFVHRMLEEEGIFYFFEHAAGKHTLVLADQAGAHPDIPGETTVQLGAPESTGDEDVVESWETRHELIPGKWRLRDFHFEMPTKSLEVEEPALATSLSNSALVMYDFPGGYAQKFMATGRAGSKITPDAEAVVKLRMQEEEARALVSEGDSTCRGFVAGHKFTLKSVGTQQASGDFTVATLHVTATQQPAYGTTAEGRGYTNRFTCIPAKVNWLPPRRTPRPVAAGTHTARVVDDSKPGGSPREEIWPDKYGRVLVRFPWQADTEASTCWVRVAQPRAGKSGGHFWLPRVGDEVLVIFLDGDVDAPVVVGSLYNGDNMPPWTLPANKTQSGIRTKSSTQGGSEDWNEFRFEDKKGHEHILLHAQKDLMVEVENDETRTVGHDRTTTIQNHETRTVKEGDEVITVEKGKQETTIKMGDCKLTVEQGNHDVDVKMGNQTVVVGQGNHKLDVKMGNIDVEAGMGNISATAKLGNITIKASVGQVTVEAIQGIELKVGGSSIKLTPASIDIKAPMINIEGQGMTTVKAPMTQINGDGMLMAKGGLTMIN